jgi:putative ubiquitin-RnfH superfamily antitoxin RatB of RatAB toxin-antitoxin module
VRIEIAYIGDGIELLIGVEVPAGTTVQDALHAAAIEQRLGRAPDVTGLAIFGRRVDTATALRDGDRIEITRPLLRDPKTARRDRAASAEAGRSRAARRPRSGGSDA